MFICLLALPQHCFFGVYDGHCGKQTSSYLQKHLAERISELRDPTDTESLKECIHKIDYDFGRSTNAKGRESGSMSNSNVFLSFLFLNLFEIRQNMCKHNILSIYHIIITIYLSI